MTKKNGRKFFIITGMSGAGKSQALKAFEDFGFYCVDNLPIALLPSFVELVESRKDISEIALGIDIREGKSIKDIPVVLKTLEKDGFDYTMLFLDASDEVLLHRFSETRHRHTLGEHLSTAIRKERQMLSELKDMAHREIDTSKKTLSELKEKISALLGYSKSAEMQLSLVSFGFKYGIPLDADLVIDVRFLKNPYYIKALRPKTGLDKPVASYILKDPNTIKFLKKYLDLIKFLVPLYMKEGKSYLTIAVGCTGGKHRSVYLAHTIAGTLRSMGLSVSEFHKDLKRHD